MKLTENKSLDRSFQQFKCHLFACVDALHYIYPSFSHVVMFTFLSELKRTKKRIKCLVLRQRTASLVRL